ncbi:MAG: hypothetical protein WC025_01360 [Candidatus Magasanikbacteria bacterium]
MSIGEKIGDPMYDAINSDSFLYRKKEWLIEDFFKTFSQANMTRQDLMWWCQNINKDSINDPALKEHFPKFSDRQEAIKFLFKIKYLGFDNYFF